MVAKLFKAWLCDMLAKSLLPISVFLGASKNFASLVFRVPNFIFLPEGRGFINELHVIFRNLFLHNEVLRKLDFLPIGFLEVPFF
jgi:hypothetical protein